MQSHSTLPASLPDGQKPAPTNSCPSGKPISTHSIETIRTEQEIGRLETDWNRLSETAALPNAFMTFGWFRIWNQCLTQEDRSTQRRLNVLVLKRHGAVAGISPLIYRTASGYGCVVRMLQFVGREADYNDLVVGDNPAVQTEAIVDFLAQTQDEWDLIDLRDLREAERTLPLIKGALSLAGLPYRALPEMERCPYLPIESPWSVMLNRLSRRERQRFRAQQSRLEQMSAEGLRVRIIENPHNEPGLLEKLIVLESQKQVQGKLSPPFIAAYPKVFQSLFDTLGPRGWLYVALMELGDRPLASIMGFRCGKKLWDYLGAYDHSFSWLSPGTMLVPALLDYGFSHGYQEYDFLRGEEFYKMRWSTGFHQTYRLMIWNRRWTSRARAFIYLDLKPKVYRLFGRTG